ncbi:hypothetical protein PsorP6_005310 [Peronosclerospora sorghi]|uniref:Uncharacterized protein n=2 Tax=Peronosclerospora sorghi TaxID=230839 RepID=A0ACC0W4E9_9STRA|nr:hypothetical protein PsorP6_005312 [Peronosclerospora sorghi]KAI9912813.1 hypothetical protein PsorP6_005310 [Peronosclerospora sorghi]
MDETTDPDVLTSIPYHGDIADKYIETNREEISAVAFLSELTGPQGRTHDDPEIPSDHVPCTGLRDQNVQAYVANTFQIVGGSRPPYVTAQELYRSVFGNDKKSTL